PVAAVDDDSLFAGSLEKLINSFSKFKVVFHAKHGMELQQRLKDNENIHEIILLDIPLVVMEGLESAEWLSISRLKIKILALTMEDDEQSILQMLRKGEKGYLLKDIHPEILNLALRELYEKGYYHSEKVSETLLHSLTTIEDASTMDFKENELTFIKL